MWKSTTFVSFRGQGNGRELHAIVEIVATMKLDNLLICLIHEVIRIAVLNTAHFCGWNEIIPCL